jgi:two-component system, OmpR family, alkaline phosphatase synthesis response regulator PhoP
MASGLKKILIVEDDPTLIKVLGTVLKNEGFTVDLAVNGEEAWEKIQHHAYNLIILDLVMPRMGGVEVLEKMKGGKYKMPVLVFTNLSQTKDKAEVLSLGAKGFYVKSDMSIKEVIHVVKKFLRQNNNHK